jgi:hypothetical protein
MEIDALVQQIFGVNCCCTATKLTHGSSEKAKPGFSSRTEIVVEQSKIYKRPIPAYHVQIDQRSLDKQLRKLPHVLELKKSSASSNTGETVSRGASLRANIAAENALVGSGSYPASGSTNPYNFATTPSSTSSDQALLAFADFSSPDANLIS